MVETFRYVNHLNEVIQFGEGGIYAEENDIRDFAWDIISKNNRYTGFRRGRKSHNLPVRIVNKDYQEAQRIKNYIFEVCEKDVLANAYGRIVIGEYYIKGYFTEARKTEFADRRTMLLNMTFNTDCPGWIREETLSYGYDGGEHVGDLDYFNDFPYDYTSNILDTHLINPDFTSSNFRMRIYGPVEGPSVTIGGHVYEVAASVSAHEYLEIDSVDKTIILTKKNGEVSNCFNARNRASYIFEKIPSGTSTVALSGDFKVDVTLLEERSEPKWT